MDRGRRFPGHRSWVGIRYRPHAEPRQQQHRRQQRTTAGDAAGAERTGDPHLFANAHESAAEPGPGSEFCPGTAVRNKIFMRLSGPIFGGAAFIFTYPVTSRAMSSGARVIETPPLSLMRTTLTVPAYSGEPE